MHNLGPYLVVGRQQKPVSKLELLMSPRVVLGGLCAVLWLLAALLGSDLLAFADNTDAKPVDQQANEPNTAESLQSVEFAEARRMLKGAAGNPECVWLGRRVVGLLWRDDLDTAFRHLDVYDRFGCPNDHIQATFRCLVLNGSNIDPKAADNLNGRVQACWVNPLLKDARIPAAAPNAGPKH
jgi:hypothetical protein